MRTLVICEKPDAARRLAEALADTEPSTHRKHGLTYFEVTRKDERITICPALGHLYVVDSKDVSPRRIYPVWDFSWKPKYEVERGYERQRGWLRAIQELAEEAERFINSCDYDTEGSLIGYMILKYACGGADRKAGRMRFSTLTRSDLNQAYVNVTDKLDYELAQAGMCRHEIDWLYGVNLSRAITESAREYSNRYATISTGRVQGPTLRFIVEREVEVAIHVPVPYWTIEVTVAIDGVLTEAEYSKEKLETKAEAERVVNDVDKRSGLVEDIQERSVRIEPPNPFDLTTIQSETYRHFRMSPSQTLRILERLYLEALISYPRTSSQKLPPSIGYREILEGLARNPEYKRLSADLLSQPTLRPREGKKFDPAHPAIYPTGQLPKRRLEPRESRVLDLVTKRFMATFAAAATRQSLKVTMRVGQEYLFYIHGSRLIHPGWTRYYEPYVKFAETVLPKIELGQEVTFKEVTLRERFTTPPPRYNPSSLLRKMEESEIGTKATRAEIIDILYKRGYVLGETIRPTPLANKVIEVLKKHCPKIVDVSFTRELEVLMSRIELGEERREAVVIEAVEQLKPIIEQLKTNEDEVGRDLSEAIREMRLQNISLKVPCPSCGLQLRIIRSKKTKKRFIGCSGAWVSGCRFSLPLPQFGTIKLLDRYCGRCGFQLVKTVGSRGRSLISCPKCYVEGFKRKP